MYKAKVDITDGRLKSQIILLPRDQPLLKHVPSPTAHPLHVLPANWSLSSQHLGGQTPNHLVTFASQQGQLDLVGTVVGHLTSGCKGG